MCLQETEVGTGPTPGGPCPLRAPYMPSASCTKVYHPGQEHLVVPPKAISGHSPHWGVTLDTSLVTAMSHREHKEAGSPCCLYLITSTAAFYCSGY